LIVNIGNVTKLLTLAPGATVPINSYAPSQLSSAFPDGFADLQWAVSAGFSGDDWNAGNWVFPSATVWYTRPAPDANTKSVTPVRLNNGYSSLIRQQIISMGDGAYTISTFLSVTNSDNNEILVREPVNLTDNDVSAFIADRIDPTVGNFRGSLPFTVENKTPDPFIANARTDLYESAPIASTDPFTGLTNGPTYYAGYFLLKPDGTMSFTRGSTNSVPTPPPPPQVVSVSRSGQSTLISFTTTNGATYTLYGTNAAGLSSSVGSWPALNSLTGDGSIRSFNDATTDELRFYRVGAH
jgi:hypothetical protein